MRVFSSFTVSFSLPMISRRWCSAASALPLRHRHTLRHRPGGRRASPRRGAGPAAVDRQTTVRSGNRYRPAIRIRSLSPLIIAIALGLVFHNTVGTPAAFRPGVVFGMRRVLRFAIILLGLQLSLAQVVEVGAAGLGIIALTLRSAKRVAHSWRGPSHSLRRDTRRTSHLAPA
jgi:hypothetical protein